MLMKFKMKRCFFFFVIIFGILVEKSSTRNAKFVNKKPAAPHPHVKVTKSTTPSTPRTSPFTIFETANNTYETAQLGSTAELECFVKYPTAALNVSWWKMNSSTLLTTNDKTIALDKRFQAKLKDENSHHWILRIRYSKQSDEGIYECRLEGDFAASIFVTLQLQKAHAVIKGNRPDDIRVVEVGSTVRLSCYLVNSIEPPAYIFWYKENRMINYDLDDGESIREGRMGSELIIPTANLTHSGNYSCVPSNADQANLFVRVVMKVKRKC